MISDLSELTQSLLGSIPLEDVSLEELREERLMKEIYEKVAEDEEDIRLGRCCDAFESLEEIKKKYGVKL